MARDMDCDMLQQIGVQSGDCAMRNIDATADDSADWSELGRLVLSEAMRRTTHELLRREEASQPVTLVARGEVLS